MSKSPALPLIIASLSLHINHSLYWPAELCAQSECESMLWPCSFRVPRGVHQRGFVWARRPRDGAMRWGEGNNDPSPMPCTLAALSYPALAWPGFALVGQWRWRRLVAAWFRTVQQPHWGCLSLHYQCASHPFSVKAPLQLSLLP